MAKKYVSRKQLLKEPDEFLTLTGKTIAWARENPKTLLYGAIALFAAVALVSIYGYINQRNARQASELLGAAMIQYEAQPAGGADTAKALEAAGPDLKKLVSQYGGQPAGRLGRILLAHYDLAGHKPDQALELYKKAFEDYGTDPSLGNIILDGLASASEMKGDNAAAIEYAQKIAAGTSPELKDVALFRLGRLYAQAGDKEKSAKAYAQLAADFPDSPYAAIAKEQVG